MININLVGKNRGVVKIQSLALKSHYGGVSIKIASSFQEVEPSEGIYVVFSSVEEEFDEWAEKLTGKKVFLIAFLEKDLLDYPRLYNKIIRKDSTEPLHLAIEAGIRYFS